MKRVDKLSSNSFSILLIIWGNYWTIIRVYETKYSRMEEVKFFKGCLPQILLGLFLNNVSRILLFRWVQLRWIFFCALHYFLPFLIFGNDYTIFSVKTKSIVFYTSKALWNTYNELILVTIVYILFLPCR